MSKAPPGVKRVVSVLNFFAGHPGQAFTFTDIVKALDLGRATCHALLAGLVEEQYLYRNNDKTYVIGPALVAISEIAAKQFSPMQAAIPEMRDLSDACRAVCSAVYIEGGEVVINHRAATGNNMGWSVPQGHRLPLRAPFAGAFFSASKSYDIEKWLDQYTPAGNTKERQELFDGVDFVHRMGFTFGTLNPDVKTNTEAPELAFMGEQTTLPVELKTELNDDEEYLLGFITSPVLNNKNEVEFVLNLSGFTQAAKGSQVREMGMKLRDAAERVTYFLNGRKKPYPFPKKGG